MAAATAKSDRLKEANGKKMWATRVKIYDISDELGGRFDEKVRGGGTHVISAANSCAQMAIIKDKKAELERILMVEPEQPKKRQLEHRGAEQQEPGPAMMKRTKKQTLPDGTIQEVVEEVPVEAARSTGVAR